MARLLADYANLAFSSFSLPVLQDKMSKDLSTLNLLKTDFILIRSRQRISALELTKSFTCSIQM